MRVDLKEQGLIPLKRFMEVAELDTLQFKKGKGRQFCSTPIGVLFRAEKFDMANPQKFVVVAGADVMTSGANPVSLEGTLWLVNATVTDGDKIDINDLG